MSKLLSLRHAYFRHTQTTLYTTSTQKDNVWTDFRTQSRKTVFKPNFEKLDRIRRHKESLQTIEPRHEKKTDVRINEVDIQMLPGALHKQVFKNYPVKTISRETVESCKRTLYKHGISDNANALTPPTDLKIPELHGNNLEEHFYNIAQEQAQPYFTLAQRFLDSPIPEAPKEWIYRTGWIRYVPNEAPEVVDYPLEEELIFDVEVCMMAGKAPTLATAVSSKAWYGWVSQALIDGTSMPVTEHYYHENVLIPMESKAEDGEAEKLDEWQKKDKIIIGHNVSFDRAKIKEQYWLSRTGTRFIDTMSMHVCVSGVTSYQRAVLKSKTKNYEDDSWKEISSLNGLSDVHELYCGRPIKKDTRDLFVTGTLKDIQTDFQKVMEYCSEDVRATHRVFKELFTLYKERFPHPVTFAGMLELGTAYLPVNENWRKYVEAAEQSYEELGVEAKVLLGKRADQACGLLHEEKYRDDVWMWDQDWSVAKAGVKKVAAAKKKKSQDDVEGMIKDSVKPVAKEDEDDLDPLDFKFTYLEVMEPKKVLLPGYPNWYRKLCVRPGLTENWTPGAHTISTSMQITPKLLNLTWEGYPLHYIRGLGWGLLVPFDPNGESSDIPLQPLLEKCPVLTAKSEKSVTFDINISKEVTDDLAKKEYYSRLKADKSGGAYAGSGIWCNTVLNDCIFFFKLPHKDGASHRVGNPLAKDFLNKFSENVLAGETESAEQVLDIARKLSYWRNNRNRIFDQMIVWHSPSKGAIIPQVVVSGTLTRRAVEPTWMTASNAQKERIGSELRAIIQAPKGYKIVGADVDSQELWIASVIGDSHLAGLHGATPFGWMTLNGAKSDGTDMHSMTAKAVGITRDHAKVINYARIYGAGQNFAERLLKQFNPTMTESEARGKASKMFTLTKGKRVFQLRKEHVHELADVPYSKWDAFKLAKIHNKGLNELFHPGKWVGGSESAMFNRLEEIAGLNNPATPFLDCRLSRALEPENLPDDRFLPTRVNWVVQSGAVDFLHLMLVSMRWLMKTESTRFCLSFHDEVRYIVKDEDKYKAALAMHVTNLLTRAFCCVKLGIYDLPYSVAFFTSVEIDDVLRKESKQDCKTPSNPHGLEKGYGIPNGESLSVSDAVEKAGGTKDDWVSK